MLQSILIVLGVMFICLVLFSPFYFFRNKKGVKSKDLSPGDTPQRVYIPFKRAMLLMAAEALLFLLFLFYFVLKGEGVISGSLAGWIAAACGIGAGRLHIKNSRIHVGFEWTAANPHRRSLVAYKK